MPRRTPTSTSTTTATTSPGRWPRRARRCIAADFAPDDIELALRYWDIGELGDMHHNPAKNVLHMNQTAGRTGRRNRPAAVDELRPLLASARRALLAARAQRPTPFIDRTLYTGWNAMAVSAYLEAARVLRIDSARDFALLTLDRLLREAWDGEQLSATSSPMATIRRRRRQTRFPARSTTTPSPSTPASMPGSPAAK